MNASNIELKLIRARQRRGLTLMELVVGDGHSDSPGGDSTPLVPQHAEPVHTSSSATSGAELSKAIQTYQGLYYGYPNGMENLATGSGTLFQEIATVSGATTAAPASNYLAPVALTAGTANAPIRWALRT